MRPLSWLAALAMWALAIAGVLWAFGLGEPVRLALTGRDAIDWIMGGFCLFWLLILLKLPWDLFFQANAVLFEMDRSGERGVDVSQARRDYVRNLRRRLGRLAVGAHIASALLVAAITWFSGGTVGYYFAVFYLVSTVFRPAAALYAYLTQKLREIGQEARYPREDCVELRRRVEWTENTARALQSRIEQTSEELSQERSVRELETRELRQRLQALARELETTVARLTDNQELIRGIQAFVRLVSRSDQPAVPGSV